ncbi:MAG: DUF3788 domain-containing protein, partial [Verrucomicrobiia bacterium]
ATAPDSNLPPPMLPNAFIGKSHPPTDAELTDALGPAKTLWDRLLTRLADEHQLTVVEWNSYSPKAGWSLRLKSKGRNIVYLGPCKDAFRVAFILGDKAVAAARQSNLPPGVIKIINEAKRYTEGTGVRFEIMREKDIGTVTKLAGIKLAY